jgi:NADPH:quinone reductase-like Zn-dependent oxidoreductase
MKVICLENRTDRPALIETTLPVPRPGPGEILVRVHAAGVTPTELAWYPTTHTKDGATRQNAVPGHEFSGTVAALGGGTATFQVGNTVYGMNDWFSDGATAEYCITQPASIAPKPRKLSHAEAASVPIGALTAWQGLLDRAQLRAGERVLIHGGAGAVGIFAIQLAHRAGAHVITTASTRHAEYLRGLGADLVLDYRTDRFDDHVREMDVVFDAVGGETLQRSWSVLKPSGRMVTISSDGEAERDDRTKAAFFIVEPNQKQLIEIAALLDSGALATCVDMVLPLEQAPDAYLGKVPRTKGRGKVVIAVGE